MNQDIDREQKIFQIMMNTKFSEEALEKMSDEDLDELYRVKVERRLG